MAREPQVLATSPSNYEVQVPTNASLTVDFSIDLDNRYIEDHVYLTDSRGVHIDARVVYKKKRITVTPNAPLEAGKSYQLVLVGDSDLTDNVAQGIRSILGDPMPGNFTVNFTTDGEAALEAPTLLTPAYGSVNRVNPVFSWEPVEHAEHYQIRISKSNRFDVLDFPLEPAEKFFETSIEPDIEWVDGIYYWTVRGVRNDGVAGEWSAIGQFSIQTFEAGTISPEDVPPVEVLYDEPNFEIELIETFPKEGFVDVPLNTKSLYFRVIGEIDVSLIDVDSFSLRGTHISGVPEDSHGDVKGQMSLVSAGDGTTYIIFTPDLPTTTVDMEQIVMKLSRAVPGLSLNDITITDADGNAVTPLSLRTTDSLTYTITGQFNTGPHTITIVKDPFVFKPVTIAVKAVDMNVTVQVSMKA